MGALFAFFLGTCLMTLCYSGSRDNDVHESVSERKTVIDFLVAGAQDGVLECRRQFMWDRWHCPIAAFTDMLKDVPLTSEQAFVHAITSASIVHAIAKNCSAGLLEDCGCKHPSENEEKGFKYDGCSDDVDFPSRVARQFFEQRVSGSRSRAKVILHNLQAGRIAVRQSLQRFCKCHGSSGSCTTKTCWVQLKGLHAIGQKLKKEYRRAVMLEETNGTLVAIKSSRRSGRSRNSNGSSGSKKEKENAEGFLKIPQEDTDATITGVDPHHLVYLEMSPDYCLHNSTAGLEGTRGRTCAEVKTGATLTKSQRRACRVLCYGCGHTVRQIKSRVSVSCKCQFVWCCKVQCETCVEDITTHSCLESPFKLLH